MPSRKKILKGDSNFGNIIKNNGYFVDKTLLIQEFFENGDKALLMPRPRRFGKTSNLSMIEHFFDINQQSNKHLFDDFLISKNKTFCEQHQNKYPVINISLKSIKGSDWTTCFSFIQNAVSILYEKHDYLLESKKIKNYQKSKIEAIILKKAANNEYAFSLFNLSKYLKKHFDAPAIIMVDEYDTPIIDGFAKNYYQEIIDFMRVFLGEAFKGNDNMNKGLITGIMRIAKESLFSGLNNPGVYTITSLSFTDKFGFTTAETKKMLAYFNLEDHYDDLKNWYDGYQFGNTTGIYNPWSIVSYISRYEEGFKPWWVNTGTDALIKKRIVEPDVENTYNALQNLIIGQSIKRKLYENFVFPNFDVQKELLWTLLTYAGYLTIAKYTTGDTFELKIPNYEIRKVFKDIVLNWLEVEHRVARLRLEKTVGHLLNNRLVQFEKSFRAIMGDTISYWDEDGEPEKVYQAYILGLLAIIGDDYIIRSNRESGKGRYDVMIMPHDKKRYGLVLEIKQITRNKNEKEKTFKGRINKMLAAAEKQIDNKKYYKELLAHKIANIIKVPIVFAEKEPYLFPVELPKEKTQ